VQDKRMSVDLLHTTLQSCLHCAYVHCSNAHQCTASFMLSASKRARCTLGVSCAGGCARPIPPLPLPPRPPPAPTPSRHGASAAAAAAAALLLQAHAQMHPGRYVTKTPQPVSGSCSCMRKTFVASGMLAAAPAVSPYTSTVEAQCHAQYTLLMSGTQICFNLSDVCCCLYDELPPGLLSCCRCRTIAASAAMPACA
jgi:hypothetical protein